MIAELWLLRAGTSLYFLASSLVGYMISSSGWAQPLANLVYYEIHCALEKIRPGLYWALGLFTTNPKLGQGSRVRPWACSSSSPGFLFVTITKQLVSFRVEANRVKITQRKNIIFCVNWFFYFSQKTSHVTKSETIILAVVFVQTTSSSHFLIF